MSLHSDWQDLSGDVFRKMNLSQEGVSYRGLDRAPIYFRDSTQGWEFPELDSSYLNIVSFSKDSFKDEFLEDPCSAVLFSKNNIQAQSEVKNIFFPLSLTLSDEKKKSLIQSKGSLNLGIDPYSLALWKGELCSFGRPLEGINLDKEGLKVFRLSTLGYDLAGATPAQQLAILLSSTYQLIKSYEGSYSAEKILSLMSFEISLSNHVFINIAKLQSFRQLLIKLCEVLRLSVDIPPIYAIPSPRYLGTREPWNNILRLTAMNFSARSGGAQGIFNLPFDLMSSPKGHRASRNNFLVLEKETFVNKVNYPSLGSGLSEELLTQLCNKSWTYFQEVEKKGGVLGALQSGWLQDEVEVEHERERAHFLKRDHKMIGVNEFALTKSLSKEFPLVTEGEKQEISRWWIDFIDSEEVNKLSDVRRLKPYQLSQEFEKWQFLADSHRVEKGEALKVTLFCENEKILKAKVILIEKIMALAGIEVERFDPAKNKVEKVCFFAAADPEGEPVVQAIEKLKNIGCIYKVWVGDRKQVLFDSHISQSSEVMKTFEQIFKIYGVVS